MQVAFDTDRDREAAALHGKRILLLFPHMVLPGGALNYMLNLAELLVKKGAIVGILTLQAGKNYSAINGVEVLTIGGPITSKLGYWLFFPFWQIKIVLAIQKWHPAVLVPQVFPANWWAWLYKWKFRDTAIIWVCQEPSAFIHSRNWIDALQPFWNKYLARILRPVFAWIDIRLSRFTDKFIANSQFTACAISRVYGRQADVIAYPALDIKVFFPDGSVEKQKSVVTVAKLSKFKRVDFLLRVFSLVLKRHPEFIYHIVGRGEDEVGLKTLVNDLRISANVQFHHDLNNEQMAALQRRAMLFLHGCIEEPFGMAPLEAIACGTPVIAHRSGGPLEFVNESCGRLINSMCEEEWCQTVGDFLDLLEQTPDYFKKVSENVHSFTWESTLAPAVHLIATIDE